jgi:hypothetical protein
MDAGQQPHEPDLTDSSSGLRAATTPRRGTLAAVQPHLDERIVMTESRQLTIDGDTPVRYLDSMDRPAPDEEALIGDIVEALHRSNVWSYQKHQHAVRDAHTKSHGILGGQLTVDADLPEHLAQGLFAAPATYDVIARLSTTAGAIRSDQVRGARGIAIKVLNVPSDQPRSLPDGRSTHDFILVNSPTFPFADVRAYAAGMGFAAKLAKTPDAVLKAANSVLGAVESVGVPLSGPAALLARKNHHLLGQSYHSASPLLYGKYVAKISIWPLSESVRALEKTVIPADSGFDGHTDAVVDFFRHHSAVYEIRAQLCTAAEASSIDDATVDWRGPFARVGQLTFPAPQDAYSPARRVFGDDVLSFNSWNGLAAHRPLGGINRLKVRVYEASSRYRHAKNAVDEIDPGDISALPD